MSDAACVMCDRYGRSDGPLHIADLALSRVFLHEDQFFPGYVLLVLRRHVTELYDLPEPERAALMEEVSRVAQTKGPAAAVFAAWPALNMFPQVAQVCPSAPQSAVLDLPPAAG